MRQRAAQLDAIMKRTEAAQVQPPLFLSRFSRDAPHFLPFCIKEQSRAAAREKEERVAREKERQRKEAKEKRRREKQLEQEERAREEQEQREQREREAARELDVEREAERERGDRADNSEEEEDLQSFIRSRSRLANNAGNQRHSAHASRSGLRESFRPLSFVCAFFSHERTSLSRFQFSRSNSSCFCVLIGTRASATRDEGALPASRTNSRAAVARKQKKEEVGEEESGALPNLSRVPTPRLTAFPLLASEPVDGEGAGGGQESRAGQRRRESDAYARSRTPALLGRARSEQQSLQQVSNSSTPFLPHSVL
jgi:hypothetical protein